MRFASEEITLRTFSNNNSQPPQALFPFLKWVKASRGRNPENNEQGNNIQAVCFDDNSTLISGKD